METGRNSLLMKTYRVIIPLLCLAIYACQKRNPYPGKDVCILVVNARTGTTENVWNEKRCRERFPACSTFKVPLALMAFDSGILRDEKQTLQWDGQPRGIDAWNRDHNAETWLRESVVWFSQRLTPMLTEPRIRKYLADFKYGNENIAAGLTDAWLKAPDDPQGALAISAYEQTDFWRRLFDDRLPVAARAANLTRQLTYLETSPRGYTLSGKTGSNTYEADKNRRFGWFVGYLARGSEEYAIATNFSDLTATAEKAFGGKQAREIVKAYLLENGLW